MYRFAFGFALRLFPFPPPRPRRHTSAHARSASVRRGTEASGGCGVCGPVGVCGVPLCLMFGRRASLSEAPSSEGAEALPDGVDDLLVRVVERRRAAASEVVEAPPLALGGVVSGARVREERG